MTTSNNPNTTPTELPILRDLTATCQRFIAWIYRTRSPRVRVEPLILPRQVADDEDAKGKQEPNARAKKAKDGDLYTVTHSGVTPDDILFDAIPKGVAAFEYLMLHGTGGRPKKAEKDAAIASALQTVKLGMLQPEFATIREDLAALFLSQKPSRSNPTTKYSLTAGSVVFTCRAKPEELVNLLAVLSADAPVTVSEVPNEGDPKILSVCERGVQPNLHAVTNAPAPETTEEEPEVANG